MLIVKKMVNTGLFEEIFSSKGRAKIVKILALRNEMNISKIISLAGTSHSSAEYHLNFLKTIEFVREKKFGRIRIFEYQNDNLDARALKNLILFWEQKNVEL
ncbi:hypothetical protein NEF87_002712 [Candidatus Lokiarchaeum ossiferum]|uniref:HTH arsR-type domain-containing protein n=1 Tax=Candidatus Lokiarchaeum ossiferum TaxID=2951803 RepID=A0ABY6HSD3_9ARCH|nr:hypothetical protein NEF87_002712 [Candidatus Lokiarchaeum sp. B-35]